MKKFFSRVHASTMPELSVSPFNALRDDENSSIALLRVSLAEEKKLTAEWNETALLFNNSIFVMYNVQKNTTTTQGSSIFNANVDRPVVSPS